MMRRAVFSELQRRGLERRFQIQKYISKPERKKLAEKLGLKDSQVRLNNNLNLIDSSRCLFIDLISTPPPPHHHHHLLTVLCRLRVYRIVQLDNIQDHIIGTIPPTYRENPFFFGWGGGEVLVCVG